MVVEGGAGGGHDEEVVEVGPGLAEGAGEDVQAVLELVELEHPEDCPAPPPLTNPPPTAQRRGGRGADCR